MTDENASEEAHALADAVRRYRHDVGLSHAELAARVGYSRQYVSYAERVRRGLPSEGLIRAVDYALAADGALVDLHRQAVVARNRKRFLGASQLSSRPEIFLREVEGNGPDSHLDARSDNNPALVELCDALTDYGTSDPIHPDGNLVSAENLARELDRAFSDFQQSRFTIACGRISSLLVDAQITADASPDHQTRDCAFDVLALTYHAASSVLTKLGQPDLALLSAERGLRIASTQTDSFTTLLSLKRATAFSLLANGRLESAMRLVDVSIASSRRPDLKNGAEISTFGTILLVGSLAASRFGDSARARHYLSEAEAAAQHLQGDANYVWTAFGPTNVVIHRANASAELGDMQAVLKAAPAPNIEAVPAERRTRYFLDVARARYATGERAAAIGTLLHVERFSPEQVRQHYVSRGLVKDLLLNTTGKPSTELALLASRMKIQTVS